MRKRWAVIAFILHRAGYSSFHYCLMLPQHLAGTICFLFYTIILTRIIPYKIVASFSRMGAFSLWQDSHSQNPCISITFIHPLALTNVDKRWQKNLRQKFYSHRLTNSDFSILFSFSFKKKRYWITGAFGSGFRPFQPVVTLASLSPPQLYRRKLQKVFFWCRPTLSAILGWKMDECLSNLLQGVSQNPTKSPKIPHCITRKLLSHKSFLRNFTASNAYAYDRLEEHMDSDSSRPELHH